MPERRPKRLEVRLTRTAQRDVKAILNWSRKEFGETAAARYKALIKQALRDLGDDPERPGSTERPEILIEGARTYHLEFSRNRVRGQGVKAPRLFFSTDCGRNAWSRWGVSSMTLVISCATFPKSTGVVRRRFDKRLSAERLHSSDIASSGVLNTLAAENTVIEHAYCSLQ